MTLAYLGFVLLGSQAGILSREPFDVVLPLTLSAQAANFDPPDEMVKLIFIHHSTGENWLEDGQGGLGIALRDNNYFVSDTNYGWGPDSIGHHTDIGHWWLWFRGADSATYLSALYAESDQHSTYSRLSIDPGGENEIIMFKSCFPNSYIDGNPTDPPTRRTRPMRPTPPMPVPWPTGWSMTGWLVTLTTTWLFSTSITC